MASSSNRKSSSSASSSPRPTRRRATSQKPTPRPASSRPAAKRPSAGAARPKVAQKPATGARRTAASAPRKAAPKPAAPSPKKPVPTKRAAAGGFKVVSGRAKGATRPKAAPAPAKAPTPAAKLSAKKAAPAKAAPQGKRAGRISALLKPVAALLGAMGSLLAKLPLPQVGRKAALAIAGGVAAVAVAIVVAVNSPLFAATELQVNGSEHMPVDTVRALVEVPEGSTLFNYDKDAILESLQASPWVSDVSIEREWPHKLIITPVERKIKAIAFMTADEVAWAIGEDGTWVAPVSLLIAVDEDGEEVPLEGDGSVPEGAKQLTGLDAALAIAKRDRALLLIDVPSDVQPKSGEEVTSEVVLAGLAYAKGFSEEFIKTVKDLSVPSVEAISANLRSGVEVSLGEPENITEKERVVTKLLEQEEGVTFVNVREPGAYTFRSAP